MAEDTVIYAYTLQQAIADGVLVEIFKNRWNELSGGKPIVATDRLFGSVSVAALNEKVWVIEDGQAYTLLYPEDY